MTLSLMLRVLTLRNAFKDVKNDVKDDVLKKYQCDVKLLLNVKPLEKMSTLTSS
jgi:hypothetical protein